MSFKMKYATQAFLSGLTFGLVPKPVNLDVDAFFKELGEQSSKQIQADTDAMFAPTLKAISEKNAELDAFAAKMEELLGK